MNGRSTAARRIGTPLRGVRGRARVHDRLRKPSLAWVCLTVLFFGTGSLSAQINQPGPWNNWGNENELGGSLVRTEGSGVIDEDAVKTAREVISHSTGTPDWENPVAFEKDVFTFARAIFK